MVFDSQKKCTVLGRAASRKHKAMVEYLLDRGARINDSDTVRLMPLLTCVCVCVCDWHTRARAADGVVSRA